MADTLDILTPEEGRTAINMPVGNSDHDAEIAQQITAVSRMIDAACGPVVNRTITAEVHDADGASIELRYAPVSSVTQVRTASGGTITTLSPVAFGETGDGYKLARGLLFRVSGGVVGSWGCVQVEATYVAGRYADTASVDERFKTCASALLGHLWKTQAGTWAQSANVLDPDDSAFVGAFDPQKIIVKHLADELRPPGIA